MSQPCLLSPGLPPGFHLRPARYTDLPEIASLLSRTLWDEPLMAQRLHPYREAHPDGFPLYWLRRLRLRWWDWRAEFLAVAEQESGKIVGFSHWVRKGTNQEARAMDLWAWDPRNLARPVQAFLNSVHELIWPNRAADPFWTTALPRCYAFFEHLWSGPRAESWFLQFLVIAPEFQGCGLGSRLVQRGLSRAETEGVCVSVIPAVGKASFYQKCGFDLQLGSTAMGDGNPMAPFGGNEIWWRMPQKGR